MYLIIKHGFDSLENRVSDAHFTITMGCVTTEEKANKWINAEMDRLAREDRFYAGWDNVVYPYYTIEYVKHLEE